MKPMRRRDLHLTGLRLLAGWAAAGPALAQRAQVTSNPAITLGFGDWPPFFSMGMQGKGLLARIVSQAFEREGWQVDYVELPWKRAQAMVESGALLGSPGWAWNVERAQLMLYSDPILISRTQLFHLKRQTLPPRADTDLRGLRVGATAGYHYGLVIQQQEKAGQLQMDRAPNDESSLRKLLLGRVDAVLLNREVGVYLLANRFSAAEREQIGWLERPVALQSSHLLMSKARPESPALLQAFNQGLVKLKQQGLVRRTLEEAGSAVALA